MPVHHLRGQQDNREFKGKLHTARTAVITALCKALDRVDIEEDGEAGGGRKPDIMR